MENLSINGINSVGDLDIDFLYASQAQIGTLKVDGVTQLQDTYINGNCNILNSLTVTGTLYATIDVNMDSLQVSGSSTINNSLYVQNNLTIGGSLSFNSFNVSNSSTIQNTLYLRDLLPQNNNVLNIGSDTTNDSLVFKGLSYFKRPFFVDSINNKCNLLLNASSTTTPTQIGLSYRDDNTYSGFFQTQGSLIRSELTSNSIMFNPLGNTGTITLKTAQNVDSNILVSHPFNGVQTINSNLFITGSQTIGGTLTISGDSTFSTNLFINDYIKINYDNSITDGNRLGLLYATGTQTGLPLIATSQGHTVLKNPSQSGLTRLIASTTKDNVFILVSDSDNVQNVNTDINFNGLVTIQNTLNVNNIIINNFSINNETTFNNSLTIQGRTTINNSLFVTGLSTFNNTLYLNGQTTIQNTLRVTGNTIINSTLTAGNAFFSGNSTIQDKLTIKGLYDPLNGWESRFNFQTNTKTSSITHYDTGTISVLSDALYVSGNTTIDGLTTLNNTLKVRDALTIGEITNASITYDLDIRKNSTAVTTGISNRNTSGYSLLSINNNSGNGLVAYINGSNRSTDGGTGTATIRNDVGKLRIQNNNEFTYGNGLNIPGDPISLAIDGVSSLNQIVPQCAVCDSSTAHDLLYVGGYYIASISFSLKNLDGSTSLYSLPSTGGNRKAYLIAYSAITGLVNSFWFSQDNLFSEVKNIYIGPSRVYVVGSYRSSASSTVLDIGGNPSAYTLPNSSSNFAGFCIGFFKNDFSYAVDRFTVLNGGSTSAIGSFMSCIQEDGSGNVFIGGSVVTASVTTINNFFNVSSGITIPAYATQTGYILRYDLNGNLTGRFHSTTSTYGWFVNDITIRQNELYMAVNVYNLGTTITIPNWQGAGNSTYTIYASSGFSTAYWTACLISFTGITTIASPTVSGRSLISNDNQSYVTYPNSSVCYDSTNDNIYWGFPCITTQYVQYHYIMTDTNYTSNWTPPQGTGNGGLGIIIYKGSNKTVYGYPGFIWSNHLGSWSGTDGPTKLRFNPYNALVYFNFSILSNQTPQFYGFYQTTTNLQNFPNASPNSFYSSYSLVLGLNVTRGLHYIPYSYNYSFCSDTAFYNSNKMYTIHNISNNAGWNINNYDTYATSFNMPTGGAYNQQVIITMKTRHEHTNYFSYKGVGIGRDNSGALGCSLECEKGILTNTYLITKEIRSTGFTDLIKFSDSIGREMGKLVYAYVQIDAMRAFYPVISSAMNIRYVDKPASGRYRCYFSNYTPHKNYSIFISSTSWASNNYTVFPFISSAPGSNGYPQYKEVSGFEITTTNTGGTGFDLNQISVMVIV